MVYRTNKDSPFPDEIEGLDIYTNDPSRLSSTANSSESFILKSIVISGKCTAAMVNDYESMQPNIISSSSDIILPKAAKSKSLSNRPRANGETDVQGM